MKILKLKKKSISIGLNPKFDFQDFCYILNKYNDYIDSIYTSPPLNLPSQHSITSRHFLEELAGTTFYQNYINDICKYCRDNNIKVDMAINGLALVEDDLEIIIEYLIKQHPEEITLLSKYANFFDIYYPEKTFYVYSYNSPRPIQKDFNKTFWDSFAVSNEFFWNKSIWPPIDKELRLILNTGCPAGGPPCLNTTNITSCKNNCITRYTNAAQFLAYHAWFGTDIDLFEKNNPNQKIKYKLTTRNRMCDLNSLDWYLYCLINNIDIQNIKLQENTYNSYIWFCFAPFWILHQKEVTEMDINSLRVEKEKLWKESFQGNILTKQENINNFNYIPTKNDNQKLIQLFLKQTLQITNEEQAFLSYYKLILLEINNTIIIATQEYNNIILNNINNINFKINYIDMALKKDFRYKYKLELNQLSMYAFGDYIYKNTFQGQEQKAINGYLQKQYYILKEKLYQYNEAIHNSKSLQLELGKLKESQKDAYAINKSNINWNKNLNYLKKRQSIQVQKEILQNKKVN